MMRVRWRGLELPSRLVPDRATMSDTYGKFSIEPFERGFGVTIGSSLRQVLLSCLEGSAVTEFEIPGVTEETTTIPGVVEDVTDIILNIKSLVVRNASDEPKVMRIDKSDFKGTIFARDIIHDPSVEIVNPDLVIATLKEETSFQCQLKVENSRGYRLIPSKEERERNLKNELMLESERRIEKNKTNYKIDVDHLRRLVPELVHDFYKTDAFKAIGKLADGKTLAELDRAEREACNSNLAALRNLHEITKSTEARDLAKTIENYYATRNIKSEPVAAKRPWIAIDSNFSPVTKVKYEIVETRVGQKTNFDKLVMQVWTNGAIPPQNALVEASKIFRKSLNPFIQYSEPGPEIPIDDRPDTMGGSQDHELERKLSMSLSELELSVRATNCLETEGIATVRDLLRRSEAELLEVRNFGETTLKEVKQKLSEHGLELGQRIPGAPKR